MQNPIQNINRKHLSDKTYKYILDSSKRITFTAYDNNLITNESALALSKSSMEAKNNSANGKRIKMQFSQIFIKQMNHYSLDGEKFLESIRKNLAQRFEAAIQNLSYNRATPTDKIMVPADKDDPETHLVEFRFTQHDPLRSKRMIGTYYPNRDTYIFDTICEHQDIEKYSVIVAMMNTIRYKASIQARIAEKRASIAALEAQRSEMEAKTTVAITNDQVFPEVNDKKRLQKQDDKALEKQQYLRIIHLQSISLKQNHLYLPQDLLKYSLIRIKTAQEINLHLLKTQQQHIRIIL